MKFETLEELVGQRRGYKYLNKNKTSPYKNFKYDFRKKRFETNDLDTRLSEDCGAGFNLATIPWILRDSENILDQIIVEFSIPQEATIIIPDGSSGKFRTNVIIKQKVFHITDIIPELKNIQEQLKTYKPINPITAKKLPPIKKIKKILAQVGAQVGDQVGAQVRDQVRAQVWAQVGITAYYAVKEFLNLNYEHPAFDLIKLGIFIVKVENKFKIFGDKGKYLGEFE
jgi:hypothetical protein